MRQSGFLIITDITGYTSFLTRVNLEDAQIVLNDLIQTLLDNIRPPLIVAKLEGDAIFAYSPDSSFLQSQTLMEAVEALYIAYRERINEMVLNPPCSDEVCALLPGLDLKVALHHGDYFLSEIGGGIELSGPDVILTHRLIKNDIRDRTGVEAYVFITDAAAKSMDIGLLAQDMHWHVETYDHLGDVTGYIHDLHPVWEDGREARRVYVQPETEWFDLEIEVGSPPAMTWDLINEPESKRRWSKADELTLFGNDSGRLGVGVEQHCRHGDQVSVHRIVDWHPIDYVTYEITAPLNTRIRFTVELQPTGDGTRVVWRFAQPTTPNPFHRVVVPVMKPFIQGFLENTAREASAIIHQHAVDDKRVDNEADRSLAEMIEGLAIHE